jgi:hypothetical protein
MPKARVLKDGKFWKFEDGARVVADSIKPGCVVFAEANHLGDYVGEVNGASATSWPVSSDSIKISVVVLP